MITLTKRLKKEAENRNNSSTPVKHEHPAPKRISIRDKLLVKEVQEMEQTIPSTCRVKFENPDALHEFSVIIQPDEGFWKSGKFLFHVVINEDYNISPPIVKCLTKLWHPNISEEGEICLSLLRQNSIDGLGWAPTRKLKDVVWGLNSLFTDLLNFEDPLNIEAAEHYRKDRSSFEVKVREYVNQFAKR
ncbi:NEDD8-conjugating enzyme UBE2F-like [Daphnia pulex]|uniref:E2 NEDD8-conjugating enzyme n=1 Tax=Daphnia pulex TaxID=6669 RepID=E9GAU8_DAPPU|nr:NEDD8-conjugating enzyme UBE2F-like [Daphnia pulex]XP_046631889.1 NEDD8-conjugating enzyme UBE2F-like [Daphnia pulicaria]EFX83319.1 hypothetical protein DAPPUDRAFT_301861 [Daphnia pulex]|eukprot:EFX83319.1 hypothetical protein DAPPUDRAFT_301861 [Daphnia pulex]